MADLITHVAFAYFIRRPVELLTHRRNVSSVRILFYAGTILPDVLTRPFYILWPSSYDWTYPLHTPLGALLVCGILALLFEIPIRKKAFFSLAAGSGLHFFIDFFQKQVFDTYFWLFPFSWKVVGVGLYRAEDLIGWIPLWIAAILLMEAVIRVRGKKRISEISHLS